MIRWVTVAAMALILSACEPAAPEDQSAMQACITRGTIFYKDAPNFPYIENRFRVSKGHDTMIDRHILSTCERSTLAYSGVENAASVTPQTKAAKSTR